MIGYMLFKKENKYLFFDRSEYFRFKIGETYETSYYKLFNDGFHFNLDILEVNKRSGFNIFDKNIGLFKVKILGEIEKGIEIYVTNKIKIIKEIKKDLHLYEKDTIVSDKHYRLGEEIEIKKDEKGNIIEKKGEMYNKKYWYDKNNKLKTTLEQDVFEFYKFEDDKLIEKKNQYGGGEFYSYNKDGYSIKRISNYNSNIKQTIA